MCNIYHKKKYAKIYAGYKTDNLYIDGSVQEKRNSIANALELRLSCTNPAIFHLKDTKG